MQLHFGTVARPLCTKVIRCSYFSRSPPGRICFRSVTQRRPELPLSGPAYAKNMCGREVHILRKKINSSCEAVKMKVFSIFPAGFIYLCDIIDAGAVSEQALRNI